MKSLLKQQTFLFFLLVTCILLNHSTFALNDIRPKKIGRDSLSIADPSQHGTIEVQLFYPFKEDKNANLIINTTPFVHADGVWHAEVAGNHKLPLILISHGWGGGPQFLAWFADALANNGFFVAIPQHICDVTVPPSFNYWHRPLDISLVLTTLLESKYKDHIDTQRIGFAGYSLGGATGIWLAGGIAKYYERNIFPGKEYTNPAIFVRKTPEEIANTDMVKAKSSFKDTRIKAEFLMSPATAWQFDRDSINAIDIPMYIVEPAGDTVLVPQTNAFFYAENIPTAVLKMIPGKADHFVFRSQIKPDKIKVFDPNGSLAFNYKDDPSVNRAQIHDEVAKLAINFFNENLNYSERAQNIEIVTNAYIELDEKNDQNAMEKFFAKNFVLLRNNLPPESYQQLFDEVIARKKKIKSIVTTPFQDIFACGNKVVVRYQFTVDMVDGKQSKGKAIAIFELENQKITKTYAIDMPTN